MTASFISELDASAASKKILTELLDTDKHATAGVLYVDGAIVTAAAPMPVGGALLTAILAGLITPAAASQAKQVDAAYTSADVISPGGLVRRDTLVTVTPAVGDWMAPIGGPYGETYVSLATAISGDVDSIQTMPVPGVAAMVNKEARYTTAQTGTALWTPASGKVAVVTELRINWSGSVDGIITVWFDATSTSDTAYTAGTDRFLFDHTVQPSTKDPAA